MRPMQVRNKNDQEAEAFFPRSTKMLRFFPIRRNEASDWSRLAIWRTIAASRTDPGSTPCTSGMLVSLATFVPNTHANTHTHTHTRTHTRNTHINLRTFFKIIHGLYSHMHIPASAISRQSGKVSGYLFFLRYRWNDVTRSQGSAIGV